MVSARFMALVVMATLIALVCTGCSTAPPIGTAESPPRAYQALFTEDAPSLAKGLEAGAWARASWTEDFVDIQGPSKPRPQYRTRAKMLWDETHLYVAAELSDPDVWATLTQHDQIVFHDNDFEVFIDPDGDRWQYYEIEVNALQTVFDLFLHKTYREGGPAVHSWNCAGLGVETRIFGTLNDPSQVDSGWQVQLSIPWKSLQPPTAPELANMPDLGDAARAGGFPQPGDMWRINFSRVQWRHNFEHLDKQGARAGMPSDAERAELIAREGSPSYRKVANLPEDNWVWSPQWAIDMHLPQFWGRVTFFR